MSLGASFSLWGLSCNVKITKNVHALLLICVCLPAGDPKKVEEKFYLSYKMIITSIIFTF